MTHVPADMRNLNYNMKRFALVTNEHTQKYLMSDELGQLIFFCQAVIKILNRLQNILQKQISIKKNTLCVKSCPVEQHKNTFQSLQPPFCSTNPPKQSHCKPKTSRQNPNSRGEIPYWAGTPAEDSSLGSIWHWWNWLQKRQSQGESCRTQQ